MKRICVCLIMVLITFSHVLEAKKKKVAVPVPIKSERVVHQEKIAAPAEATHDISFEGKDAFDPEKKRQDVVDLVNKGVDFFNKHSALEIFQQINHTNNLCYGELFLFIYDDKGTCLARSQEPEMMWENFVDQRDVFGVLYIKNNRSGRKWWWLGNIRKVWCNQGYLCENGK